MINRFLIIVSFLGLSLTASAAPLFEVENVFTPQDKHVHSSSMIECPNGDLLVCWFHGTGERTANDVVVNGSRKKKGKKWSPIFEMADTPDLPDCNPVLFVDSQERLWLFWSAVVSNGWQHSLLRYRRAEKYQGTGAPEWSWQDIIIPKPGEEFANHIKKGFEKLEAEEGCWAEYALPYEEYLFEAGKDKVKRQKGWMTRNHLTVLPSGRILLPLYSDGFNFSLIGISDDEGQSWRMSEPIIGYGPTQPSLAVKKDGTIVAYLRDEGNAPQRVMTSISTDQGETWSPAKDTDIPNPSSSAEVLVLKDGRWILLCNDTETGRHRLVLKISDDEGTTWKRTRQVEPSDMPGTSFEYPSMLQSKDGLIHLSYTRKSEAGKTIAHCTLNLEWLDEE